MLIPKEGTMAENIIHINIMCYLIAQTVLTAAKRPSIMTYSTEPKRIREVPTKPNYVTKHNPYGILKKYK